MSDEVTFSVEGIEEIIKKLEALPEDMRARTGKRAMQASTTVVANVATASAPIGPKHSKRTKAGGLLKTSIKQVIKTRDNGIIGNVKATAPHAHLVEYGFVWKPNRRQKHGDLTPRRVEPKVKGGWLRNALYRNADKIRAEFAKSVEDSLKKLGRE